MIDTSSLKTWAAWARILGAVALVLGLVAAGILIGEKTGAAVPEVVTYRVPVRQADHSLIAERTPEAALPRAPHLIPKGWKEERRISATIKPEKADCPHVDLDMSLVRDDEGGRRVILSSPDGEVVSAKDIPIEPALIPAPTRRWAAGLAYEPDRRRSSVWLERDLARVRVGAEVSQSGEARVRLGWVF